MQRKWPTQKTCTCSWLWRRVDDNFNSKVHLLRSIVWLFSHICSTFLNSCQVQFHARRYIDAEPSSVAVPRAKLAPPKTIASSSAVVAWHLTLHNAWWQRHSGTASFKNQLDIIVSLASIWSVFLRLSRGHRLTTCPKEVPNTTAQPNDHSIEQRTRTVRFVFTIGTAERKGSNEASVYVGSVIWKAAQKLMICPGYWRMLYHVFSSIQQHDMALLFYTVPLSMSWRLWRSIRWTDSLPLSGKKYVNDFCSCSSDFLNEAKSAKWAMGKFKPASSCTYTCHMPHAHTYKYTRCASACCP